MPKKKIVKRSSQRRKSHSKSSRSSARYIFYISLVIGILIFVAFLHSSAQQEAQQREQLIGQSRYVLGDDDSTDGPGEVDNSGSNNDNDDNDTENDFDEDEFDDADDDSITPGIVRIKTESHDDESETEIETADGQKIKTKIEDDGTTKIEVEHRTLKIKYEFKNGQFVTKVEDEDGEELELDEDELDEIEDEVENELEEDGIKIASSGAGRIRFAKNNITAITNFPLSIDVATNSLIVTTPSGQKTVAILPDQAVENLLATGIITRLDSSVNEVDPTTDDVLNGVIEFKIEGDEPVYEIKGIKEYRLFAVLPISTPLSATVSSETGEVIDTEKSFFATLISLLSF